MIDLAGAVEHPDLCDAALSYLLERMRLEVEDPSEATRLKLMVVDEAWRYLQDPAVLREALSNALLGAVRNGGSRFQRSWGR